MKEKILAILLFGSCLTVHSQSYIGYFQDNYSGVNSVLFNPASIADSRFRADINLFSVSGAVGNDLYAVKLTDVFKDNFSFDKQATVTPSNANNARANFDIMGPSFMFNIAPKHTLAVFTRARSFTNVINVNGELIDIVKDGLSLANDFNLGTGNVNTATNSWGEVGLAYAAVLLQNKQHFLKGGITAKYLQGGVNGYVQTQNVNLIYKENKVDPRLSTLTSTGEIKIGASQDFESNPDYDFDSGSKGYGFDLGLVYEWRPDYEKYDLDKATEADNYFKSVNKYKLRFGLSLTDIGSINYRKSTLDVFNINGVVTQDMVESVDGIGQLYDFLNDNYTKTSTDSGKKASLPTALHAAIDWNIHNKFYLNVDADISMSNVSTLNRISASDRLSITPRYESKWFSFYLPVSFMEYTGTQIGSGIRLGAFFIGSGSVVSNLVSNESKGADFHLGFKVPIYQKKFKDRDGDGIIDKKDKCKKIAGAAENKGCPWPDTDGDGVTDNEDSCINISGPAENKGCPWSDTDGDTLFDNVDQCPDVAGPIENNGCPWPDTDNDGVLDKDDACPTVAGLASNKGCPVLDADNDGIPDNEDECPLLFGPKENNGCPKVTKETLEQLKVEAKSIFFNTGKATLSDAKKGVTSGRLDAIKEILKNYPNAKFSINGHTDNVGNAKANQKLSEQRAQVVMEALIARGVNANNLVAKGFGATKPVKSNATAAGRAENRRTEIVYLSNE